MTPGWERTGFPAARCSLFGMSLVLLLVSALAGQDSPPRRIGDVLERLAVRAPERRPAPFRVEGATRVQAALVLDGTTSMSSQLASLATACDSLGKLLTPVPEGAGGAIVWTLAIFRDAEAPSGVVSLLEARGTDPESLARELRRVQVESGEPYLNDALDVGLHAALTRVAWDESPDVARHIVILTDAPPYAEGTALRAHSTSSLIDLARRKQIRVHGLQVRALPEDEIATEDAQAAAAEAAAFLQAIALGTQGLHLDLGDPVRLREVLGRGVLIAGLDGRVLPDQRALSASGPATESVLGMALSLGEHPVTSVQEERELRQALEQVRLAISITPGQDSAEIARWRQVVSDGIAGLEWLADLHPTSAVWQLQLVLAHARLAVFGQYEHHASRVAWHAWHGRELARADATVPESWARELDGWYQLHVAQDGAAALDRFAHVAEEGDDAANPGCSLRARWAWLAILSGGWAPGDDWSETVSAERAATARRYVSELLDRAPQSVEARRLAETIRATRGSDFWLHEELFGAAPTP